jgi:glyoxylase-like metal-dependent hydrolase (beta-lactamase superfamily II)
MEMSEKAALPKWVVPIQNSRLILSGSGAAYLVDCGNARILAEVRKRAPKLDGIFITHYHDDHTDHAQAAADAYGAPVHYTAELRDVLENPLAFRLPAMTANPIRSGRVMREGQKVRWHEYEFEYVYYPGQTILHDGLIARRDGGETLFFVGDTFTPSGLDDYCLLNRNLLDEDQGYFYCLRKLRSYASERPWIINQHVEPMFRFTAAQISRMEDSLRKRKAILRELIPFDHPNYGVDEQWAWFHPYGVNAQPGETVELKLMLRNHSLRERVFTGTAAGERFRVSVPGRGTRAVPVRVTAGPGGVQAVTATIELDKREFREWAEALIYSSR